MADEDDAQKTEEPTSKKLEKAREQGQVAKSTEVNSWFLLMGGTITLLMMAPLMMDKVRGLATTFIENPHAISFEFDNLRRVIAEALTTLFIVIGPFLGLMVILALAAGLFQIGFLWAPAKLKPDFSKLNVIKALKNRFSLQTLIEFTKGIFKIAIVGTVSFGLAIPLLDDIALIPQFDLWAVLDRLHEVTLAIAGGTVLVLTFIAALDLIYQRYQHTKTMRMTKQEVKDENKQSEGDPQIKARIRRIRMERAQARMMAAVPRADVVITNPTHFAVALEYKMETMPAPKVIAKGVDSLALRIRGVAEEHDIPLVENPPLARALYAAVELDQDIPPEHYQAVAEVIGYVMRLKGRLPART